MTPKLIQNQITELNEKQKMKVVQLQSRPQSSFQTLPQPKNSPLGPQKIRKKLSRIQMSYFRELKKMKVVQLHELTPKQFLNYTWNPKIAHQGPKKSKKTSKLSQNQLLQSKEKIKVVAIYEQTPKPFESQTSKYPILAPKKTTWKKYVVLLYEQT